MEIVTKDKDVSAMTAQRVPVQSVTSKPEDHPAQGVGIKLKNVVVMTAPKAQVLADRT